MTFHFFRKPQILLSSLSKKLAWKVGRGGSHNDCRRITNYSFTFFNRKSLWFYKSEFQYVSVRKSKFNCIKKNRLINSHRKMTILQSFMKNWFLLNILNLIWLLKWICYNLIFHNHKTFRILSNWVQLNNRQQYK